MNIRDPLHESVDFGMKASKTKVSSIRKRLMESLNVCPNESCYQPGIQMQIDNPTISNKVRHLGHLHKSQKSCFGFNFNFVSGHSKSLRNKDDQNFIEATKRKNSYSVIKKHDSETLELPNDEPSKPSNPRNRITFFQRLLDKSYSKDKSLCVKEAAIYLIRLGNSLKNKYNITHKPGLKKTKSFNYRKIEETSKIEYETEAKHCDNLMNSFLAIEKLKMSKTEANSLKDLTEDDITIEISCKVDSVPQKNRIINSKKEGKKKKKRFNTITTTTSGLTFAEKMEQLAIGKF